MPQEKSFLRLSAHWLSGRYHGAEWPPSPARAYQALLAGVMTGSYRLHVAPQVRDALLWLERQPAPWIQVREPALLSPYRLSVPNNDLDKAALAWSKGNSAEASKFRTMKVIQPRQLPGSGPHLQYLWALEENQLHEARQHEAALRSAAHCLHTLGWGTDMAFADAGIVDSWDQSQGEIWVPATSGRTLAVPIAGFFEDLESAYRRFQSRIGAGGINTDTRPRVYGEELYQRMGRQERILCAFHIEAPGSLDEKSPAARFRFNPERTVEVAAWVRHAAQRVLAGSPHAASWLPYVSGHVDEAAKGDRLSYVPLPSIGTPKTDAWIRRILLVESTSASGEVSSYLYRALNGYPLTDEEGKLRASLSPLAPGDPVLRQYLGNTAGSRTWHTVTPVVLHGFNSNRGRLSLTKTAKLLTEAFVNAGYPAPLPGDVFIQAAPLVPQLPAASRFFLPQHLRKWPRYHVGVTFRQAVRGPVLVGLGRHAGLGIFHPVST